MNRWLELGLLVAVPLSALADEAAIRRVIESKLATPRWRASGRRRMRGFTKS